MKTAGMRDWWVSKRERLDTTENISSLVFHSNTSDLHNVQWKWEWWNHFFFNPSTKLLPCLFKHQCMIKICIFSLRGHKCIIYNCVLKCWHKYFISLHMRWLTVPQHCRGCNATTGNPWALLVHVSHCGYSDKPQPCCRSAKGLIWIVG